PMRKRPSNWRVHYLPGTRFAAPNMSTRC
ncbi:hypothetical protein AZ019_000071, partial [Klebsiella pneumoniae]